MKITEERRNGIVDRMAGKISRCDMAIKIARAGESFENSRVRVHQFMNSIKIWDLTNAGKRGKKVDIMTIMTTPKSENDMLDSHIRAIKAYASSGFDSIVSLMKDLKYDYPEDIELDFSSQRGVDVTPHGFSPIKIKTKNLLIVSDYNSFTIRDLNDSYNEPTCIPAAKGGKKSVKLFYKWVDDNQSKIKRMTMSDVVSEMKKNGIKFHQYCAVD